MKNKQLQMAVTGFKLDAETGTFTCYGNTKGNIDHALDRSIDGCYQKSIDEHMANGTMPKMFWMHNPYDLPVGKWIEMREDSKGLFLKGQLSKSSMGQDMEILAKEGALDMFSIGYCIPQGGEKWNADKGCNDLIEIDIKEISWVNFACNEESRLEDIKSKMQDGELPTKRELQKLLHTSGLSNRQAEKIANNYSPEIKELDVFELMSKA